jgi:hypothetical protein
MKKGLLDSICGRHVLPMAKEHVGGKKIVADGERTCQEKKKNKPDDRRFNIRDYDKVNIKLKRMIELRNQQSSK